MNRLHLLKNPLPVVITLEMLAVVTALYMNIPLTNYFNRTGQCPATNRLGLVVLILGGIAELIVLASLVYAITKRDTPGILRGVLLFVLCYLVTFIPFELGSFTSVGCPMPNIFR